MDTGPAVGVVTSACLQDPELILSKQRHEAFLTGLFILNPETFFAVKRPFIQHQEIPSLTPPHHGVSKVSTCAAKQLHEELLDGHVVITHHANVP